MSNHAPGLAQELALKTLSHLFASGRWQAIGFAVLLLISMNLFSSSAYELLLWLDDPKPIGWKHHGFSLASFPVLLLILWAYARKAKERLHARVEEEDHPRPVAGLVLYLSLLGGEDAGRLRAALGERLDLAGFRAQFGRVNWRMPVEALAYHAERLERLVVIPSSGPAGSVELLPLFRDLIAGLFPRVKTTPLEQCFSDPKESEQFKEGVEFENAPGRLSNATNAAYEYLRQQGLKPADILIDVTGGQKTNAIVGCAVALAVGRRIQYVSTHDYRIRVYDVSYEL